MRIGLIDVDGHNFPNLALMRISTYHKQQGDTVEWWWSGLVHYDIVYMSKVFSDTYSADKEEPVNADKIVKGGTGYAISTIDGRERYDKSKDTDLPNEIEQMIPDYSIYPQYDYTVSMTSRGCPRGCPFCHVAAKEGRCSVKVADVSDFYAGQKLIKVLDPNITACKDKFNLLEQYAQTNAWCDFTQGVDARLLNRETVEAFNQIKIKNLHFAWDDMKQSESVLKGLECYMKYGKIQDDRRRTVYLLTNFDTTHQQDLERIYKVRDMGFTPDVRIYNKPSAPRETRLLQRWVNNRIVFKQVKRFEDFDPSKA